MKNKKLIGFLIVLIFLTVLIVLNSTLFTLQKISVNWLTTKYNLESIKDYTLVDGIERGESIFLVKKNEIANQLEKKYPYLKVHQRKGITILEGLADDGQSGEQTVLLTPSFVQAISPLFPYIDNSEKRYLMNGKKVGLYEVISTFRANEPKNMERAKGLGALNSREIGISTLSKDNRKLLRYTANDINKEISDMRKINDDKYSLIKGVDISQYEF